MDSKEIKSALKEARDAIKNKDFSTVMKICKNILKYDKENYMALVFLGISLQEVGPKDQAPFAFRKAITASPNQILAWNGLANYYEKDESDSASKELIPIYEKILSLESDATKFDDACNKLVSRALKVEQISEAAEILRKVTWNDSINENNRHSALLALASLLTQANNWSTDLMELLEVTLSTIVKKSSSVTTEYYKEYLKLLYKMKKYEDLFDEAVKMHTIYESNVYPLEWICKVYVELVIENNPLSAKFENRIDEYCQTLMKLQENSVMATFSKAVQLYASENYADSRDELKKVVALRAGLTHAWVLLAECLTKLHCYNEAAQTAIRADKLLQSLTKENPILRQKVDIILISALSKHSDVEKCKQAVELGKKLLEENEKDSTVLESLITACIRLAQYDDAKLYIKKLQDPPKAVLYAAKILHKRGDLRKAFTILKEIAIESYEYFFEMGLLFWELEEFQNSLMPFLKAAKLDPYYYMSFVYLARYYEHIKDLEKARRCYQKAFKVNPYSMEAGVGLSSIYRRQKNWDANFELLQNVTSTAKGASSAEARWAWLQLGLHYLEQGEYSDAIDSLRSVIRAEPNNGHFWECLADAYMARGAYTAALKSYERSAELLDDALYSKLQVATIKLMLSIHSEARLEFENLLEKNRGYVPALKGLAENCLNLATIQRNSQLLGLCRGNAQYALNQLTLALKERSDLSCLWKLTGDSCALVASLPEKHSYMMVDSSLAEGQNVDEVVTLYKIQLYTLAARCYCKAISLTETNYFIWHDLAACYYEHACVLEDLKQRKHLFDHAQMIIKYCISKNPNYWQHWNLLGITAVQKDVKNYALAQHAFIKVVNLERHSAIGWSNLGTLYLLLNDVQLANKAYSQAQRADPSYTNSWIGQALIAESMGHEDAMDLFRHSTQLGYHPQGALGYASWVCKTVLDAPPRAVLYSIHNMHAIPVAGDNLIWFTENNPCNPCAWNMLGLLKERLGLKTSTIAVYKKSLDFVDDNSRDKVLINCARMFLKINEYTEAVETYQSVKAASFNSGTGLALALFKAKRYQESYDSYDTVMNWLTDSENLQSHALVALAAMAYMFKGPEEAKTLLFQSTQLKPPSQWGLFALLALGLIHGDLGLAHLVLKELQPMKDDPEIIYHYSLLLCLTYLREGDSKATIRSLTRSVHRHPDQASLWHFLSIMLLRLDPRNKSRVAAKCAEGSMKMGRTQMDVSKVLCVVSLATCVAKDWKKALLAAQRAIHCYPDVVEGWAVLISVLTYLSSNETNWKQQTQWVENAKNHVLQHLNPSEVLVGWLNRLHGN